MSEILDNIPDSIAKDIHKSVQILKEAGCSEIYIFGSIAKGSFNDSSDIDIAVRGLDTSSFFKVYGKLLMDTYGILIEKCKVSEPDCIEIVAIATCFTHTTTFRGNHNQIMIIQIII